MSNSRRTTRPGVTGTTTLLTPVVMSLVVVGGPARAQEASGGRPASPRDDAPAAPAARPIPEPWSRLPRAPLLGAARLDETYLANLINYPAVVRDLGLSAEAMEAIDAEVERAVPSRELARLDRHVRNTTNWLASGRGTPELHAEARAAMAAAQEERAAVIRRHLDDRQNDRLGQILLQRRGIRALQVPEVAEAVNLSPGQVAQVRAILADRERDRADLIRRQEAETTDAEERRYQDIIRKLIAKQALSPEEDRCFRETLARNDVCRAALVALDDGVDDRLFDLLNRVQRLRYQRLLGPLIDIDPPVIPPGRPPA